MIVNQPGEEKYTRGIEIDHQTLIVHAEQAKAPSNAAQMLNEKTILARELSKILQIRQYLLANIIKQRKRCGFYKRLLRCLQGNLLLI
jgi:hypothetical protein